MVFCIVCMVCSYFVHGILYLCMCALLVAWFLSFLYMICSYCVHGCLYVLYCCVEGLYVFCLFVYGVFLVVAWFALFCVCLLVCCMVCCILIMVCS